MVMKRKIYEGCLFVDKKSTFTCVKKLVHGSLYTISPSMLQYVKASKILYDQYDWSTYFLLGVTLAFYLDH